MNNTATHNFHLPLPEDLYQALRKEAEQANQPLTQFTREILKSWFKQKHQLTIEEQIAEYAVRYAGTEFDLDPTLEKVGIDHVLKQEKTKGKK